MTNTDSDRGFYRLCAYIEMDLDFPTRHYNTDHVKRRIRSRMLRTSTETYDEYLRYVKSYPKEQKKLLESFSINVTGFFRDELVWEEIQSILSQKSSELARDVRVWCAGCADGREPYSVALLALTDDNIDTTQIDILGTDINEAALDVARKGVYTQRNVQNIRNNLDFIADHEQFVRYCTNENVFEVCDTVKEMVEFQKHDVLTDDAKHNFDLVICRNLLIYIGKSYEDQLFTRLHQSLNRDGFLVIGKTESIPKTSNVDFESHAPRLKIYEKSS